MLESVLGVRLLLWTGNPIPTPSPSLLEPLRRVEVRNDAATDDGFQLTFALTKDLGGRYDVVDTLAPGTRVWIGAVLGVVPEPLIDGVVERHDLEPSDHPGETTLTVTGTTVTSLLGLEEKNAPFANQPDHVIVARTLASYPELGFVPDVTPTTDVPIELQRTPQQRETDLALVRRLAEANSFVFYSEPITFGVNRAHWGPVVRAGVPQRALTRGMGSHGNCRQLSFTHDSLAPEGATGTFVEPITKMRIPIPALPALRLPPLSASPAGARRTTVLRESANTGPLQTALASVAAATRAPEAVHGQGSVETARYGAVLRARGLVGVRGAGLDHDGFYYVTEVTHSITRGSYTQGFGLSREGTGTLTPAVLPLSQFLGKYRGVVTDIQDPLMTLRIKASVPDVYGDGTSGWAMPCAPFGGNQVGLFALPTVGAGVWIEFEHGDPDYPVWTGCWWGSATEVPTQWLAPPYKKVMVVTPAGHSITIDDTPGVGGITLQTAEGAKVVLSATGTQVTNGQGATIQQLTGPQVSVNNGALDVT